MTDHDRVRHIVDRDIYRRMNQIGGMLHLSESIGGILGDLVIAIHNEVDPDEGEEIFQYWLISDHLAERMIKEGFCVIETDDGYFYGRTTAGTGLEDDITTLLKREARRAAMQPE